MGRVVWPLLEANVTLPEAPIKRHFWLMQLPQGKYGNSVDMQLEVWRTICLVDLNVMNAGLRRHARRGDQLIWMVGPGS